MLEFPKMLFRADGATRVVPNAEAQETAGLDGFYPRGYVPPTEPPAEAESKPKGRKAKKDEAEYA